MHRPMCLKSCDNGRQRVTCRVCNPCGCDGTRRERDLLGKASICVFADAGDGVLGIDGDGGLLPLGDSSVGCHARAVWRFSWCFCNVRDSSCRKECPGTSTLVLTAAATP